jgi:hypothetical protein
MIPSRVWPTGPVARLKIRNMQVCSWKRDAAGPQSGATVVQGDAGDPASPAEASAGCGGAISGRAAVSLKRLLFGRSGYSTAAPL